MSDPRINKESAKHILDWCFDRLGKSRFNGPKPKLIIHNKENKKFYGYYGHANNTINIYLTSQDHLLDLISTIIHEFWHYKQNTKMYDKYLYKYKNKENYDNHPYEISANNKANKLKHICYEELFNKTSN